MIALPRSATVAEDYALYYIRMGVCWDAGMGAQRKSGRSSRVTHPQDAPGFRGPCSSLNSSLHRVASGKIAQ